jgi:hypothetical protein
MKYNFLIYFAVEYAIKKVQDNQDGQEFEWNRLASVCANCINLSGKNVNTV